MNCKALALLALAGCGSQPTLDIHWSQKDLLPMYGTSFSATIFNNILTFCGGIYPATSTNENTTCYYNNQQTFSLPAKRGYAKSFTRDGKLFILGGRQDFEAVNTFWQVNLASGQTTTLAPMNHARIDFAFGVFDDGKVIVVGGTQPNETGFENVTTLLSSAELYDPTTNTWTDIESFPYAAESFSGIVINGVFTVFGGLSFPTLKTVPREYHHDIYQYNNGWQKIDEMPIDLSGFGLVQKDNDTFIIGGHSLDYGYSDRVFNWQQGSFTELTSKMFIGVNDVSPLLANDKILILGGEIHDPDHKNKTNIIQEGQFINAN